MIHLEPGLYLRVQQLPERAPPLPLQSGFSVDVAYRALGIYSPSETSECYYIVANDRDETWFISNRHFRVVGLFSERRDLRFPLGAWASRALRKVAEARSSFLDSSSASQEGGHGIGLADCQLARRN